MNPDAIARLRASGRELYSSSPADPEPLDLLEPQDIVDFARTWARQKMTAARTGDYFRADETGRELLEMVERYGQQQRDAALAGMIPVPDVQDSDFAAFEAAQGVRS